MLSNRMIAFSSLFGVALTTQLAIAGPVVTVGRQVPASQRVSVDSIEHRSWDRLLRTYVDERGFVNYAAWQASNHDMRALDDYLSSLSRADVKAAATRESKLAYWINAYNAVTVKGILREYPTSSIRNHTAKVVGYNIWKDLKLIVGDRTINLDQIEHKVLRRMNEPRIHFAIVCASVGCPRLLNEAYTPAKLATQLDTNTRAFFANPRNFRFDTGARRIYLSSILNWFATDFGPRSDDQLRTIAPYLPTEAAQQAAVSGNYRISYLDYDWGLNDQAR